MPVVRFDGEGKQRAEWGVKRGQNVVLFLREKGSSGRQQRVLEVSVAAPGRASRGRRRPGRLTGPLGWKGGGREVGHGWAERGRERGGPRLGQNRKWLDKNPFEFYLEFGFLANFGNLHKEIPKEF
jgi:hypothetical protein